MADKPTVQEYADRLADSAKSGDNQTFHTTYGQLADEDYVTRAAVNTNLRNRT